MPTPDRPVLLDTHALLWWKAGSDRLSEDAAGRIGTAPGILISPITAWETAMLVRKKRVQLDRPVADWIDDVLAGDRMETAALTATIAVASAGLEDFHGDPADRFLVATARALGVAMVTKDRRIHDYAARTEGFDAVW